MRSLGESQSVEYPADLLVDGGVAIGFLVLDKLSLPGLSCTGFLEISVVPLTVKGLMYCGLYEAIFSSCESSGVERRAW